MSHLRAYIDHTSPQSTGVALAFDTSEFDGGGQKRTKTHLCLLSFDRTDHKARARLFVQSVVTWKTPLEALEALAQLEKVTEPSKRIPIWWVVAFLKA